MWRRLVLRLLTSIACFAAVQAHVSRAHAWHIRDWIVTLAKRAGCQPIFASRVLAWGPNGPFFGDDAKTRAFNLLAWLGPWWLSLAAGFAAALIAYALAARWSGWRLSGYRGPTRCGRCGYVLTGLRQPTCPECGT